MIKLALPSLLLLAPTIGCSSTPPTSTSTGTGGTGGAPQANLESFAATSIGFDDTETVNAVIAISDVVGSAGCALATSIYAAPPGDGHEIVVRISTDGSVSCAAGTYAVLDPGCGSNGLDGSVGNCAEYRKYAAGSLVGRANAASFVVTLSDDGANNTCNFDVQLGFDTSGTYSKKFAIVYTGPAPWCMPGQ